MSGDIFEMIRVVYSFSAIVVWAGILGVVVRYGPRVIALVVAMTAAITKMSSAMERAADDAQIGRETTDRIEDACRRIEQDTRVLRELLATHVGKTDHQDQPESKGRRRP